MRHAKQESESIELAVLLALAGGLMDCYSYLVRDHVFANAQTGNMVLLGLRISEGHFSDALRYLLPILAFVAGVLLAEWIKSRYQGRRAFHWRQLVLGIEIVLLCGIGFIPDGNLNPYVTIAISLVCALQVESFRTLHELTYATTMCTGNLRSGTEQLFLAIHEKDGVHLQNALKYFSILFVFIAGAVAGFFSSDSFGVRAIWIPFAVLVLVFVLLWHNIASEADSTGTIQV